MEVTRVLDREAYFHATGYHPHPAQLLVHRSRARHRALSNGRRWGKTLLGGKEAEATAWFTNKLDKPQRGWIVGPQYTDGEKEFRFCYDSLRAMGVEDLASTFKNNRETGNMHITLKTGWDLEVKSAQHPETLVGEGLDFVVMVEAGRLRRDMFTQYIRPALSDNRGWSLMTGVPEIATDVSLLYWAWLRGQDEGRTQWASFKMPSWTNPIVFPGGRMDEEILEAEDELTEDEFARQYGGEFVEKVGRVMQEWDDSLHLRELEFNPDWPLYAGVDYGFTNPFVWLWIQVDPWDNVYVLDEHYVTLRDTAWIAQHYIKYHPLFSGLVAFYPDPADPEDTEVLQKELRVPARTNTGGELKTRLALIRERLKPVPPHAPVDKQQPRLIVDRNKCPRLAWEMREGYRWPENKSDIKGDSEIPMDKDNHGPEALGRFMKGYFTTPGAETQRSSISSAKVSRRRMRHSTGRTKAGRAARRR